MGGFLAGRGDLTVTDAYGGDWSERLQKLESAAG